MYMHFKLKQQCGVCISNYNKTVCVFQTKTLMHETKQNTAKISKQNLSLIVWSVFEFSLGYLRNMANSNDIFLVRTVEYKGDNW